MYRSALRISHTALLLFVANSLAATEPQILMPCADAGGTTWQYTTDMPSGEWSQTDFDDGEWATGKSGFGVTDHATPPSTIGTGWTTPDIWLRSTIDVADSVDFEVAAIRVKHDEDVEVYVNGKPVFAVTGYNTRWESYDITDTLRSALKPGRNLVAAHVHQTTGGQYVDLGLVLDPKEKPGRVYVPFDFELLRQYSNQSLLNRPWPKQKALKWFDDQPWPCGFNYIPANAISYTEMWMPYCFDPQFIDEELVVAEDIGFNCLRVVLPFVVWEHDPAAFKRRLASFLAICDKRGIKVMFALFDDCAFGSDENLKNPTYGRQPDVLEGWYANGWTPSPGHDMVRVPSTWPRLEEYVKDVIGTFKHDRRVWVWDLYNEPTNGGLGNVSILLVKNVFHWAREVDPTQPLTVGQFNGNALLNEVVFANSDIVTFHDYGPADRLAKHIEELRKHGRPLINTEWLNRGRGSLVESCLPVFAKENVGCMHWGLVNGKTQTDLAWGWRPGRGEPKVWQHDLFHTDRKPYRVEELKLFRETILRAESQ